MTLLQNVVGEQAAELLALTEARHRQFHPLEVTEHVAPLRRAVWGKVLAIQAWFAKANEGDRAIMLDTDVVMHRAIRDDEFPGNADLGMVVGRHEKFAWLNSGVMFLQKRGDALAKFFETVWNIGPQPRSTGCPAGGEQGPINMAMGSSGLALALMGNAFNSYYFTPCEQPIISGFHGYEFQEKKKRMLQLLSNE